MTWEGWSQAATGKVPASLIPKLLILVCASEWAVFVMFNHGTAFAPKQCLYQKVATEPWRKIGRRPGTNTTSQTGNGGLD